MDRISGLDARVQARIAGLVYLMAGAAGAFAEVMVRGPLVVRNDAAATATHLLTQESLYRLGGAVDIFGAVCDATVALLFYELFKPVNRSVALLAAFFRLIHVAILAVATLAHFGALVFLTSAHDLAAFTAEQLNDLALASLRLQALGYSVALVFFGFACVTLGYLIAKSRFLPRIVGILMVIAGLGYLIGSFVRFLAPAYYSAAFRYITVPAGLGELVFILWLLVVGLDRERWNERAMAAASLPHN